MQTIQVIKSCTAKSKCCLKQNVVADNDDDEDDDDGYNDGH